MLGPAEAAQAAPSYPGMHRISLFNSPIHYRDPQLPSVPHGGNSWLGSIWVVHFGDYCDLLVAGGQ